MSDLAAEVHERLSASGQTLAVAESLTGGLLAATIVAVPGISATFRGGLVVYATDLKASLAGVPADLLAERGPVDPDVAKLLEVLFKLRASGNTLLVIEHNLDVIKTADWIIDLGPEGGEAGGRIVAQGTPEDVARKAESYTGQYLIPVLADGRSGGR